MDERWILAQWPLADGGGPGLPFVAKVYESEDAARAAFPDGFELAYTDDDPEPFVTHQVMALEVALGDPFLAEAYLAYLRGENDLLRWELDEAS